MRQHAGILGLAAIVALALTATTVNAADSIRVGVYSQQKKRSHASAGASITVNRTQPGHQPRTQAPQSNGPRTGTTPRNDGGPAKTLPGDAPILDDPTPAGGDSFWYPGPNGESCLYVPDGTPACYTITDPGPAAQPVQPATIAAMLASRVNLEAGQLQASPARGAITGAPTWFWLDPAPRQRTLAITTAGETVTVTAATPEIAWRFGDTHGATGGAGVPYRPGPTPAAAVVHVYQTRCLPGDRGRNPTVLASCDNSGYSVEADVRWQIGYHARGPINQDGTVSPRTTTAELTLPVTESRAFLVGAHP